MRRGEGGKDKDWAVARIRTIKPEFPHSESMGSVSRDSRLLFILMWTLADDSGRLRGNSRMLASLLFPYDSDVPKRIDDWLGELEREKCIVRYVVDGNNFIQIHNWLQHQKIDKPSASKLPPFENIREDSPNIRECSSEDQGPRTKDQGVEGNGKERTNGRMTRPTLDEVSSYCEERQNGISPQEFLDFYDANGWVQGRGKPIKDWRAAVRTWEKNHQPCGSRVATEEDAKNWSPHGDPDE